MGKRTLARSYKKLNPEKLKVYLKEHPNAYQIEVAKMFDCTDTAVRKAYKRLGIMQKKTKRYREQDPVKLAAYQSQIADIPSHQIAYIDETGIDTYIYREYAYSVKGEAVYGVISGRKYQRTGIVAAQMGTDIIAPLQYDGTMNRIC